MIFFPLVTSALAFRWSTSSRPVIRRPRAPPRYSTGRCQAIWNINQSQCAVKCKKKHEIFFCRRYLGMNFFPAIFENMDPTCWSGHCLKSRRYSMFDCRQYLRSFLDGRKVTSNAGSHLSGHWDRVPTHRFPEHDNGLYLKASLMH